VDAFDRRTLPAGPTVLVASALESRGVLAAFTERTGGVSARPFDSLNLGFAEGDDPTAVRANRAELCAALGIEGFAAAAQVHGPVLHRVGPDERVAGYAGPETAIAGCDALEVSARGLPVAILTADCVPVALADDRRAIAVHAGWRGIREGVVPSVLRRFPDPTSVTAAIGPSIGPCHYEVGEEIGRWFLLSSGTAVRRRGRWFVDLPGAVERSLAEGGVTDVARVEACTFHEPDRFFSYRRDGRTGRQAMVVVRR